MSADTIRQSLKELVQIHTDLLATSEEKTRIVKEGSIENLQTLLVKERKLLRLSEQAEKKRQQSVSDWCEANRISNEDATITTILKHILSETEQVKLESIATQLTELITKLKQQEQLNQALISQSMQFVQLSLDLMSPTLKSMNYGVKKETEVSNRSVFDSKA
ncbi:flagellar protein FlgN [Oceanobacillus polygoni]|uniref:Flagellar biosynthesis/type III secretory pathway chaperone n=1 Tax=Oceanobacillus polygoni TaxID=1235259 RepID=A0A9X0YV40_9BACI|nr:flagellar protein FlgN [Oceanobacillus polygoni]MBP2078907.1 flagellar biosynthesis/type III secretory pathway chaperone [Oceanobacillus polygoni]